MKIFQSEEVAWALYNNMQWDWPITYRKRLIIAIAKAQKPCYVTGIFFIADFKTYITVGFLKTISFN